MAGGTNDSRAPVAPIVAATGPGIMSPVKNQSVVRQIGSLFDGGSVAGLTDRQLIERFTGGARCRRRGGLRRARESAWANGPGHLPPTAGRSAPRRRRLSGCLPGSGTQSPLDWRSRPPGELAVRCCAPHGQEGARPTRSPTQERGIRLDQISRLGLDYCKRSRWARPPNRRSWPVNTPRFSIPRSTACPGHFACRSCSITSRD